MHQNAPAHSADLWATGRCLTDDLKLGANVGDATSRTDDHQLLQAFVEKRSHHPVGQETITLDSPGVWHTLHAGRWRGVTWHQTQNAVVWLGGAGYHKAGSRSDAYAHVRTLDLNGELRPVRTDFEALDEWRVQRLAAELLTRPSQIVQQARSNVGEVFAAVLAGRIQLRVVVEAGEPIILTVAIGRELLPGPFQVPKDWVIRLLAAFFPSHPLDKLSVASDLAGAPLGDEYAFCYFDDPDEVSMAPSGTPGA